MCESKHKHNPSEWAGSWKAVREFWKCADYAQKKDWHCAVCGEKIEQPYLYNVNIYLSLAIVPILFSVELQALLPLYKTFPSPVFAAVYCIAALYFDVLLEFRFIPSVIMSFGEWDLASLKSNRIAERFAKMRFGAIFKVVIIFFVAIVFGLISMSWFFSKL